MLADFQMCISVPLRILEILMNILMTLSSSELKLTQIFVYGSRNFTINRLIVNS